MRQTIIDAPHKDLRRARSAGASLIPTSTGSATAIAEIFPELKGRLDGHAVRVPLTNASLTDCVFEVERPTTVDEVNAMLKAAADGELSGILGLDWPPACWCRQGWSRPQPWPRSHCRGTTVRVWSLHETCFRFNACSLDRH